MPRAIEEEPAINRQPKMPLAIRKCHWPSFHNATTLFESKRGCHGLSICLRCCPLCFCDLAPDALCAKARLRPRQRLSQRQRLRPCQSLSQHGYGRRGGGGRGRVETPQECGQESVGACACMFFPSPLLRVVRCARLAGAQRSRAARPQRGSVNVRTPEEHRQWRVRVWRHWPPAGRYLWRPRDSDSNSNDPAILQGTTLRGGVFRCLLPRAPT